MAPQNFNHIVLSQQAVFGSCTTPILSDGAITPQKIGTLASVVIQDITYTAASGGTSGNSITITYIEDVLPGQEMVTVVGSAITVHIGSSSINITNVLDSTHFELASTADIQVGDTITQGIHSTTVSSVVSATELQVISTSGFTIGSATDSGLLSTATQVLTAVQNSYLASTLVTAVISGTPSNKQIGTGLISLSGGQHSVVVSGIQANSNPLITGNVQFISGANVTLVESGNSITINASDIDSGVSSLNGLTGAVILAAGSNISITPSGNTLTISSTSAVSPGGSNGDVQFNNSGTFGGNGNLTYNGSQLTVTGTVSSTSIITSNFKLTTGPISGYVLTSDANGNGTWQFFSGSGLTPGNFIVGEIPAGLVNGSNTVFTTAFVPVSFGVYLYLNGMRQKAGVGNDYTLSGSTITFSMAPQTGDTVLVDYIK